MAAVNYATIEKALEATIKEDGGVVDLGDQGLTVYVTREPEPPTMEQCPAVQVSVSSITRQRARIGTTGSPHDEQVTLDVRVIQFSAHSVADARCEAMAIAQTVLAAIDAAPTLDGTVCGLTAGQIQVTAQPLGETLFGVATIRVAALVQS